MQIAVTGATGFLGRHLIKRLIASGHDVRAWHRSDSIPTIDTGDSAAEVHWVRGDLNDRSSAEALVRGCDAVVHTALSRGGDQFMDEPDDPLSYYHTNVNGSLSLMQSACEAGCQRFVFVSSGAVHQRVAEDLPLDERHPLWPASLYGACKAAVETLIHSYGFSGKIQAATVRPVSIVGVDDPITRSKWFDLVRQVVTQSEVPCGGGGKVVTVDQVARSIQLLLETPADIAGQTYNCVHGYVSRREVAQLACEYSGQTPHLVGDGSGGGREMKREKLERLGLDFGDSRVIQTIVRQLVDAAD